MKEKLKKEENKWYMSSQKEMQKIYNATMDLIIKNLEQI
jgi:hypothetical protein